MTILVTGGAGYIGSHTCIEMLNKGYDVVIIDNLDNSNIKSIERVKQITGKEPKFYQADVRDRAALDKIFTENKIDEVIHFAGLKAVGESVQKPLEYYDNNLISTIVLLEAMRAHNVKKIVFSSSATVYGLVAGNEPLGEELPTSAINPYGRTKVFIEHILIDLAASDPEWSVVLLRYFNPLGAHESGLIGEDPNGIPNNLMPYIAQVAVGRLEKLNVFGDDYNTPDGSCIRDFIDVVDLAKAHVVSMRRMLENDQTEAVEVFNLGTGRGLSVLELIDAFQRATGVSVPYVIGERRAGDIEQIWAEPKKANTVLGWRAEVPIEDTMRHAWAWQCHLMQK